MKKILIAVMALGLFAFIASSVQAEENYVKGGFEMSGHVTTGAGYQRNNNKASTYRPIDSDGIFYDAGPIGKYLGSAPAPKSNRFTFFVDEVELDVAKSFGENIRLRADLDFGRVASSGRGSAVFVLEQAYGTANIPLGNGIEVLLGRFNTPMGFEAVDVNELTTISKSIIAEGLRPTNTTGVKLYYAFSDLVDLHFYVVNSLTQDSNAKLANIPSLGLRLGFNWGEEAKASTFGISPFFGPESRVSNKHFTFGGDMDLNWWITDSFALGAEAFMRRDNNITAVGAPVLVTRVAGANTLYVAGLLNLHYLFSDVWDGTLQYVFAKQFQAGNGGFAAAGDTPWMNLTAGGLGAGIRQAIHEITLAGGYSVADGAKLKLEGRMDIVKPSIGGLTQYTYGGAMAFAYDF